VLLALEASARLMRELLQYLLLVHILAVLLNALQLVQSSIGRHKELYMLSESMPQQQRPKS
jgi:hypothetical protein